MEAVDPAIAETLELYNYAKLNGVAVFFITGRTEDLKSSHHKKPECSGIQGLERPIFQA